jgi:chorismate mutase
MRIFDAFANAQRANRARRAQKSGGGQPAQGSGTPQAAAAPPVAQQAGSTNGHSASQPDEMVDLMRRRDALTARVAELQWDLGGLVYEMAIRDQIRVDVIVKRAAALQEADAELNEIERIVRMEQTGTAGSCPSCGAPHSSGAVYCWQCGKSLLAQVPSDAISGR